MYNASVRGDKGGVAFASQLIKGEKREIYE
jgi:hypothetical protein